MPIYTPAEFVSRLASNALTDPAPVVIHGLVRSGEDPAGLLYCATPRCDEWIALPLSIIDSVEHIRTLRCDDHEHPYVKITLKKPASDNPEATALLTLLGVAKSIIPVLRAAGAPHPRASYDSPISAYENSGGCEYYEFDGQVWLCCCRNGHCECGGFV